ncbi:MAG: hypothetical protein H8D97_00675 [Proteobacteria bacterium]|nr:hypothetical protein [Pseudomonadota bacterium]
MIELANIKCLLYYFIRIFYKVSITDINTRFKYSSFQNYTVLIINTTQHLRALIEENKFLDYKYISKDKFSGCFKLEIYNIMFPNNIKGALYV